MEKKTSAMHTQEDFLVDLTFHKISASLLADFADKIVRPYYGGNLNFALQDLIQKALLEQEFILSHITHLKSPVEAMGVG